MQVTFCGDSKEDECCEAIKCAINYMRRSFCAISIIMWLIQIGNIFQDLQAINSSNNNS